MVKKRQRLVVVLLLLLSFSLSAQQDTKAVSINITPQTPFVGDKFVLSFSFPTAYLLSDQFIEPSPRNFPRGITVIAGPTTRFFSDHLNGDRVEYNYILEARFAGEYAFDSFKLETKNGQFSSQPFTLAIEDLPIDYKKEVKLNWRNLPAEVYQGEAFALVLELENLKELINLESIPLPPISSLLVQNAEGWGDITEFSLQDIHYYNIPIGSWIISTDNDSDIILPAIRYSEKNTIYTLAQQKITIKQAPRAIAHSGAIGNFNFSYNISKTNSLKQDEIIFLTLRIDGEGNFHVLTMPEPELTGLEVVDKQEKEFLNPAQGGYSGYREITYRLKVLDGSTAQLIIPSFIWLNIGKNQIEHSNQQIFNYKIASFMQENLLTFFTAKEIVMLKDFNFYTYLWPFALIIATLVLHFINKKYKKNKKKVESLKFFSLVPLIALLAINFNLKPEIPKVLYNADQAIARESWYEAIAYYALAEEVLKNHQAAIAYNKALCYQRINENGWAIYNLYQALYKNPFHKLYASTLQEYQKREQIHFSTNIANLNIWLFPAIMLGAFLSLALTLILGHKIYWHMLFLNLTLLLTLIAAGYLFYISYPIDNKVVVINSKELKRIPDITSSLSITAIAGSSFKVIAKYNNYYLLKSSINSEGWTTDEDLAFIFNRNSFKNEE